MVDTVYAISGAPDSGTLNPMSPTIADAVTASVLNQALTTAEAIAAGASAAGASASAVAAAASANAAAVTQTTVQNLLTALGVQMAQIAVIYSQIITSNSILADAQAAAAAAAAAVVSIEAAIAAAATGAVLSVNGEGGAVTGVTLNANNLSDLASAGTARTNLGLGSAALLVAGGNSGAATLDSGGHVPAAQSLVSSVAGRPGAVTLAAIDIADSALAGRSLLQSSTAAAARAVLGATTIGSTLLLAADAPTALIDLGATTVGAELLTATDAPTALGYLGVTALGKTLLAEASTAALQTTVGLTRVLLGTLTASNSPYLGDTTLLTTAGYQDFEIVFENILPVSAAELDMLLYINGGWQTSGYLFGGAMVNSAGSAIGYSATTKIPLSYPGSSPVNAPPNCPGLSGKVTVWNAQSATNPKHFTGQIVYNLTGTLESATFAGAWMSGNQAVAGFVVSFITGNISTGSIKIYGLK